MENSTRRVSTPLKGCGFAAEDFIKDMIGNVKHYLTDATIAILERNIQVVH